MPLILSQIRTDINDSVDTAVKKAVSMLSGNSISAGDIKSCSLYKTSLDARHHVASFVNSVYIELANEQQERALAPALPNAAYQTTEPMKVTLGTAKRAGDIVIAGFGPAGMFAALTLAENGYNPIVYERGGSMEQRTAAVAHFWETGELDTTTNAQFGEGGAGTFSDGKLTTRISDPLCGYCMDKLIEFGAPAEIATKAKPHIGTDKLRDVVTCIRERIIALGGQVHFNAQLTDIGVAGSKLRSVTVNGMETPVEALILSIGHSARDTFAMLADKGILMEAKAFSVGARIEHLQSEIDKGLYGKLCGHPMLPRGEYQLSYRKGGRGVYTFCMCPGGTVVPAASEPGGVVVNGMSEYARDKDNANSAIVVSVSPEDFGSKPLDGVAFARSLEQTAFRMGGSGYKAPATTLGYFLNGKSGLYLGRVKPSYEIGIKPCDFGALFPPMITDMMREGIRCFGGKIRGFDAADSVLTGVETRTSSPVRMTRGEDLQSVGTAGLYPCGEGAGYAGGIVSAAVDGIRIALRIMEQYAPN